MTNTTLDPPADFTNPISLLLVGATKTGKTHYGGQLLLRLNNAEGNLVMDGVAENLAPYEEVLTCLAQGRSAGHTPTVVYHASVWPVRSRDGLRARLLWPDYGGEQVERMSEVRTLSVAWQERVRQSNGWMCFVRLTRLRDFEDFAVRPATKDGMEARRVASPLPDATAPPASEGDAQEGADVAYWSGQARLVELLQMLLYVKRADRVRPILAPALTVVISCWDEMDLGDCVVRPDDLLADRLPLLSSFVRANWAGDSLTVVGLSAQGKVLDPTTPDADYVDNGPETQGWVILPDGTRDPDLTTPVSALMRMAARHESV